MLFQNALQRGHGTGMRADHLCSAAEPAQSTLYHLMRAGMRKQDQQIRGSDTFIHAALHLTEDLGFMAVPFTQILILTLHTFITADDDYTHREYLSVVIFS